MNIIKGIAFHKPSHNPPITLPKLSQNPPAGPLDLAEAA